MAPTQQWNNISAGYNVQKDWELLHWDFLLFFTVDQDSVSRGETAAAYLSCYTPVALSISHNPKLVERQIVTGLR